MLDRLAVAFCLVETAFPIPDRYSLKSLHLLCLNSDFCGRAICFMTDSDRHKCALSLGCGLQPSRHLLLEFRTGTSHNLGLGCDR